jgi:FkbM family methyltransferase
MRPDFDWNGATLAARAYLWYARKCPNHPMKLRLIGLVGTAFFSKGLQVVDSHGARLAVNVANDDFIPHEIRMTGGWESKSLALAHRLMASGGIFVDVGAHFGLYTCSLGNVPGVACIAIEPAPSACAALLRNLSLNPGVRAKVVSAAVGRESGTVRISAVSACNSGTMTVVTDRDASHSEVFVRQLPLAVALKDLDVTSVRLVKIDVEGFEMNVLNGIEFKDGTRPENLIVEIDDRLLRSKGASAEQVVRYMKERGYRALTVEGAPVHVTTLGELPENNIWFETLQPSDIASSPNGT